MHQKNYINETINQSIDHPSFHSGCPHHERVRRTYFTQGYDFIPPLGVYPYYPHRFVRQSPKITWSMLRWKTHRILVPYPARSVYHE